MTAFHDRYIILIGGYQYEQTYYLNATHGPSYGLPTRMCPQHTAAAQGVGCLPHCAVDMKNTTYMDGPVKGANWSREYNNDGKCSRAAPFASPLPLRRRSPLPSKKRLHSLRVRYANG